MGGTRAGSSEASCAAVDAPAARLRNVSKHFGATRALSEVDLEVQSGTIHALVGENGAGKSTALGILAGRLAPSSGDVELFGQAVAHANPRRARELGLAAIYQELTIVPDLDVVANVYLGHSMARAGVLSTREMRAGYAEACEKVGLRPLPPGTPAGALSVADQQVLEILRALVLDARLILFDEPTASLGNRERKVLLALMGELRDRGKSLVFVSHNLDEVLEVADAITVFRGGREVATAERSGWDKRKVVTSMIGDVEDRELSTTLKAELLDEDIAGTRRRAHNERATVLEVEGLTVPGAVEGIDLSAREGEIVGLGGLVGSGRTSVLRALAGLTPRAEGRLRIDGREVGWPNSVRKAQKHGIALLPEDRKGQGLVLGMSAAMNVMLADLEATTRLGVVGESRSEELASSAAEPFGFDSKRIGDPAGSLSGGNQQKLMLARLARRRPRVLLVDEPTRGIDITTKDEVMTALQRMADEGMTLIVISSELEELALICDRVIVLAEGREVGVLDAEHHDIHVKDILDLAFGVEVGP